MYLITVAPCSTLEAFTFFAFSSSHSALSVTSFFFLCFCIIATDTRGEHSLRNSLLDSSAQEYEAHVVFFGQGSSSILAMAPFQVLPHCYLARQVVCSFSVLEIGRCPGLQGLVSLRNERASMLT